MFDVIFSGVSRSGDDWRVISITCDDNVIFFVERNQGSHDSRFFMVGKAFLDREAAITRCKYFMER